ncbi:hypothetical protein, partial [Rufibacter sp. XAAS-G3-1]|uniref:hypothetical protein n=1 Tax=Rufibacter sp. XAAS-G3-1 TaxID=2729134 RepID=UPI001C638C23
TLGRRLAAAVVKHLKKLIYISLMFCLGFKFADKACYLENGKYKVLYDKQFSNFPKFEFEVKGKTLTELNTGNKEVYTIKDLSERSFQLVPPKSHTDSLTNIQKALVSLGQPYYEITNCTKDTIEFILRVNLHITSHSGKFVRIK